MHAAGIVKIKNREMLRARAEVEFHELRGVRLHVIHRCSRVLDLFEIFEKRLAIRQTPAQVKQVIETLHPLAPAKGTKKTKKKKGKK